MKLAISNIAWESYKDEKIFALLKKFGISGIELAPTKVWPEWKNITLTSMRETKKYLDAEGFQIPAMQAILFGKPELQIFDVSTHKKFLEHFKLLAEIAYELDTKSLVFGAPNNRKRNQLSMKDANNIAVDFFAKVGNIFEKSETSIVIENNPVEYMCDYMTNVNDVEYIVNQVNSENIKVHVDSAGVYMCGGDIGKTISNLNNFSHYHISEPMLRPIYEQKVDHLKALKILEKIDYKHWISIEMKQTENAYEDIKKSLEFLKSIGV